LLCFATYSVFFERESSYFIYGDSPKTGLVRGRYDAIGTYTVKWFINGDRGNVETVQYEIVPCGCGE